jgi:predicted branched-subunit amino acid permease
MNQETIRKATMTAVEKMIGDIRNGAVANLPVGASVAAYGSVLGMLAAQKGITGLQLLAMNLSIFAGSAQFVMVEMWAPPLPILEMILAVMIINMRYLLIGASLEPLFVGKSLLHKAGIIHLVADENWAVTMAAYRRHGATTGFLLGGGICLCTIWSAGTLLGHQVGALVAHPERFALDFAFFAVFTALTVSMWRGTRDIAPWITAALLAVAADHWLPGKWYIVVGGIGGALVPAFQKRGASDGPADTTADRSGCTPPMEERQ